MFDKKDTGKYWDFGWQLIEGCTKYSPGCANCWSLAKEKRFRKEIGIVFHEERLNRPMLRKKPASYAIWNDLFHEEISFDQALEVLFIAEKCPQHIFMILTKRPERMREFFTEWAPNPFFEPLPNVWLGVTSENQEQADKRIPTLLQIPAAIWFVSVEPMLCDITLPSFPDFVICGPETGLGKRECKKEWIESLYSQCKDANVPFFDKKDILGLNIKQYPR